jgi:hypothetical protein
MAAPGAHFRMCDIEFTVGQGAVHAGASASYGCAAAHGSQDGAGRTSTSGRLFTAQPALIICTQFDPGGVAVLAGRAAGRRVRRCTTADDAGARHGQGDASSCDRELASDLRHDRAERHPHVAAVWFHAAVVAA